MHRAVEKGGVVGGAPAPPPPPPTISSSKKKILQTKFLNKNNMWDFGLLVEQDITDKKKIVFSGFVVLTVTNNEFLRFSFSLRTFCKNK